MVNGKITCTTLTIYQRYSNVVALETASAVPKGIYQMNSRRKNKALSSYSGEICSPFKSLPPIAKGNNEYFLITNSLF